MQKDPVKPEKKVKSLPKKKVLENTVTKKSEDKKL